MDLRVLDGGESFGGDLCILEWCATDDTWRLRTRFESEVLLQISPCSFGKRIQTLRRTTLFNVEWFVDHHVEYNSVVSEVGKYNCTRREWQVEEKRYLG